MTKAAVAEKPETPAPSLDEVIAVILNDPADRPAVVFDVILGQIRKAINTAEQEGKAALARALDPSVLDPAARGVAHDCEYAVQRYRNAATALTAHLAAALKREAVEAWSQSAAPVRQRVTDTAKELAATYEECVKKLLDLFQRVGDLDKEVSRLNSTAPRGVEQLCGVEQRIGGGAKIIERVRLPWSNGGTIIDLWPPKSTWALDYAASVHAGIVGAPPVTEADRIAASERQIDFVKAQEAGREKLNAEAHARAEANAAEQRQLSSGELPR